MDWSFGRVPQTMLAGGRCWSIIILESASCSVLIESSPVYIKILI